VGPDNIARSLFHAISLMAIFIVAWGAGIFLFFVVKRKTHINDLSFLRLFLAAILFFIPIVIEFSILTSSFLWELFFAVLLVALCLSVGMRFYSKSMPVICFTQLSWVRKHCFTIIMVGFIMYFWSFSFFVGIYKPQLKKEYEMILYDGGWYYVLARYHDSFILSKSFTKNNNRFIIFRPEDGRSYEIALVKVRL
ncbi:hypothetical protein OL084_004717, partial [Salmonella enterica]|nr:hypothetical protein [Salmonella enterica]